MRICPILLFLLFVSGLHSQEAPHPSSAQIPYVEREQRSFNFYPGGKLSISSAVPGSLKIIGWKMGSVRIDAETIVYSLPPEEAKSLLKKHPLRVRWNQTSASVLVQEAPARMEVNLTVYVPGDKTDLIAKIPRGDISIESVNGWIETSTGEGCLEARSLGGYFSGVTPRGDIVVELSGLRWKGLELAAMTQHGSVDLRLPERFSAALQLETRNGSISVDYPEQIVDGEPQPPDILINGNAQSLKATVGDGGAPIRLLTYSGNVSLVKID